MTDPITPEQAKGLLNTLIAKAVFSHRVDILGFTAPEYYALKSLLQSAARPEPQCPTEEALAALIKPLWLAAKPSKEAQLIRSNIAVDSGKYPTAGGSYIPDYVWDLVDIAAQRGIEQGRGEPAEGGGKTGLFDKRGAPICVGNVVHWTDGGDDLSLAERISTRWDRIAVVEMKRIVPVFRVIDSPHEGTKAEGHTFNYGSFIYKDTKNHLTVVAENESEYRAKFKNAGECMAWVLHPPAPHPAKPADKACAGGSAASEGG